MGEKINSQPNFFDDEPSNCALCLPRLDQMADYLTNREKLPHPDSLRNQRPKYLGILAVKNMKGFVNFGVLSHKQENYCPWKH